MVKRANENQQVRESSGAQDGSQEEERQQRFLRKRPWSQEEDALVRRLVEKYGPQRWSFIAKYVPGRLGKQCRERWHNHLNPSILKVEWMPHEEWILFLAHNVHGNKWADMTKMLQGRTDNSIKNHWNSTMKKKIPEFMEILLDLTVKKKSGYLTRNQAGDHFLRIEKELLTAIYEDKENVIRIRENTHLSSAKFGVQRKKTLRYDDNQVNTTAQPKLNDPQPNIKTAEKFRSIRQASSLKKSESGHFAKENLCSFLYDTPPKSKLAFRNVLRFESAKIDDQGDQMRPQNCQTTVVEDGFLPWSFMSPSKFILRSAVEECENDFEEE